MRSLVLAGLVVLAGCKQTERPPAAASDDSVLITVSTTDQLSTDAPVPTPMQPSEPPKAPIPADNLVKGKHYQALGTERFWSFEVNGDKLLYSSPEQQTAVAITASLSNVGPQLRYTATMDGKPILLTIEPGKCSDGMSDTVYSYKASFTWGDQTEQGCARPK